jgi:hypothetical protein
MAIINGIYLNLGRMSEQELLQARLYAEERIRLAWEDIHKILGEMGSRETVEFEPVQLPIPELDATVRY